MYGPGESSAPGRRTELQQLRRLPAARGRGPHSRMGAPQRSTGPAAAPVTSHNTPGLRSTASKLSSHAFGTLNQERMFEGARTYDS